MKYYLANNGQQEGPFTPEELASRGITPSSLVWCEGMTEWTQAGQVPELSAYLLGGAQAPSTLPNGGFTNCQQQPQSPFGGQPPFAPQQPETAVCPKTWLVESILVTLFCCLPFGIVGIIKASQVESQFRIGNYAGAQQSSADAGKWTKLGFFIGLGVSLLYILLVLVGVVGSNL